MRVALKAARVAVDTSEMGNATKILERAAEYQEILSKRSDGASPEEDEAADCLRLDYYTVRMTLAWRQDRMDTAEHMFTKCKQFDKAFTSSSAENLADLLYEIGKDSLTKHAFETAIRWLERANDVLGEQDIEKLSPEASDLRLSTMHSIGMHCLPTGSEILLTVCKSKHT